MLRAPLSAVTKKTASRAGTQPQQGGIVRWAQKCCQPREPASPACPLFTTETQVVRKNRNLQNNPSDFNNLRPQNRQILNFFSRPRRARRFHRGIRVLRASPCTPCLCGE